MWKIAVAAGCVLFSSQVAQAQDNMPMPSNDDMVIRASIDDSPAPEAASPDRWTGGYVGLTGGYANIWDSFNAHANGVLAGAFTGYNIRVSGPVVAGLEFEYNNHNHPFDDGSGVSATDSVIGKLRVGYAHDRLFAYGLIGAQNGNARVNVVTPAGPMRFPLSDMTYVIGAGVDVAVTDRISVGGEYSHAFYHSFDFPAFPVPVDVRLQQFKGRLSYKIN